MTKSHADIGGVLLIVQFEIPLRATDAADEWSHVEPVGRLEALDSGQRPHPRLVLTKERKKQLGQPRQGRQGTDAKHPRRAVAASAQGHVIPGAPQPHLPD